MSLNNTTKAIVLPQPMDALSQRPPGWLYVEVPAWGSDGTGDTRGAAVWAQPISPTGRFVLPTPGTQVLVTRDRVGSTPYVLGLARPLGWASTESADSAADGGAAAPTPDGATTPGGVDTTAQVDSVFVPTDRISPLKAMTPKVDAELVRMADAAADAHGLPRALVRAIISKESTWRPKMYNSAAAGGQWRRVQRIFDHKFGSGKILKDHAEFKKPDNWGAWGLCQIMLLTALDRGFDFDAAPKTLLDPATNLKYACRLLKLYYKHAGGDIRWTAAMYHAGRGNVEKNDPSTWPSGERDTQAYSATVYGYYLGERLTLRGTLPATATGDDNFSTSGLIKGTAQAAAPAIVSGTETVRDAVTAPQPGPMMAARYPHNQVLETPGGHMEELDDTEGAKRKAYTHPSGAFDEVGNEGQRSERWLASFVQVDGKRTIRSGARLDVVECERRVHTDGEEIRSSGSYVHHVKGPTRVVQDRDVTETVIGRWAKDVTGEIDVRCVGPVNLVGTAVGLGGADVRVQAVSGQLELFGNGEVHLGSFTQGVKLGSMAVDAVKRHLLTDAAINVIADTMRTMVVAMEAAVVVAAGENVAAAGAAKEALEIAYASILELRDMIVPGVDILRQRNIRTFFTEAD